MSFTATLNPMQIRILGCLMEKQKTTPDQYPLSLNGLKNACNQKTSRDPVVNYYEGEIGAALNELESLKLVSTPWSGRTAKYDHRLLRELELQSPALAVLATLMLRGAQTAAEIRSHSQRLHAFDDVDDVEYVLQRLQDREPALALQLPRQPGQKEQRFVQLLGGEPDPESLKPATRPTSASSPLEQRVAELEARVEQLEQRLTLLDGHSQTESGE
jgi:uncharacterized protein YceH (UPF0502 family)